MGSSSGTDALAPRPAAFPPALRERLETEPIAWLTTVRPDGAPHLVPVWFVWDGGAFLVFSKPVARKVRNVEVDGRVMLAIGRPEDDFDVQLVEGEATLLPEPAEAVLRTEAGLLIAKYRAWMDAIGLGLDEFAATYTRVMRIAPTRFLGWRGRTGGRALGAAAIPQPVAA